MYLTIPTVHKDHIYILARVAEREPRTDDGEKKKEAGDSCTQNIQ